MPPDAPTAPTPDDWTQLRGGTAVAMSRMFDQLTEQPPQGEAAEQVIIAAVTTLAEGRSALRTAVHTYIKEVDPAALWSVVREHVPRVLVGFSAALGAVAAHRETRPELAQLLLTTVDAECPIWGRLVRNLSGGLLYVQQEGENPSILAQFVVQGTGISGVRATETERGLRLDASPEPAEKLALFFGV